MTNARIGVYDPVGDTASRLADAIGRDLIEEHFASDQDTASAHTGPLRTILSALPRSLSRHMRKQAWLASCRHAVVVVRSPEGLSILFGAIRELLGGDLWSITVVTDKDLSEVLSMGDPDERDQLTQLEKDGRFHVAKTFSVQDFIDRASFEPQ